jgi:RNA polymerase sigma factor (TIGR02999 family)
MDATVFARTDAIDGPVVGDQLFDLLYAQLHRLARRELHRRGSLAELGVTTLLHEAYLKVSVNDGCVFPDRARFMAYAARVMRGLIIDDIRRRRSQKRGGLFHLTSLGTQHEYDVADPSTLLKLADALDDLARVEPDLAEIIELKFFCGLSFEEIAAMRDVSARTIQRSWDKGRLYLHRALSSVETGRTAITASACPRRRTGRGS